MLRTWYGLIALAALMASAAWQQGLPAFASLSLTSQGETIARSFSICGSGPRRNCVIDGDTLWLGAEKIRLADINTPEVSAPQCAAEAALGAQAKRRLHSLLNAGAFEVRRGLRDEDVYGRKLRTLHRNGQSLGDTLVAEGLAHRWHGYKHNWCG